MACSGCRMFFTCKNQDQIPYILPCKHSGCLECITIAVKNKNNKFECRFCQKKVLLPPKLNVNYLSSELPINIYMISQRHSQEYISHEKLNMQKTYKLDQNFLKNKSNMYNCAECNGKNASLYCKQCSSEYCEQCFSRLHSFAALKKHSCFLIDHLQYFYKPCQRHPDMKANLYCELCSLNICAKCTAPGPNSCKDHNWVANDEGYGEQSNATNFSIVENRKNLTQLLSDLKKNKSLLDFNRKRAESSDANSLIKHIKDCFMNAHNTLEVAEFKLLQQLSDYSQNNLSEVFNSVDEAEVNVKNLLGVIDTCSNEEFKDMIDYKYLKDSVKNILERNWKLEENINANPILQVNEKLLIEMETYCKLIIPEFQRYQLTSVSKTTANLDVKEISTEKLNDDSLNSLNSTENNSTEEKTSLNITENNDATRTQSLDKGTKANVIVTHVDSPVNFYVQTLRSKYYLAKLSKEFVDKNIPDITEDSIVIGNIYVYHDKFIGQNCRVKVISHSISDKEKVSVNFVDYGSTKEVPIISLKPIIHKYANMSSKVLNCRLSNCTPASENSKTVTAFMTKVVKSCKFCIMCVNNIINFTNDVDLIVIPQSDFQPLFSLNETLVFLGYACTGDPKNEINRIHHWLTKKVKRVKIPLSILKNNDEVTILHITSPREFYIRKTVEDVTFHKLCDSMNDHYNMDKSEFLSLPQVGKYIACCAKDSKWYRGCIETVVDKSTINVQLTDSGESITVAWDMLRELHDNFYSTEQMAIKCFLYGIEPKNGNWCPESNSILAKLKTDWNPQSVTIYENVGPNEMFGVKLFSHLKEGPTSINDEFVKKGLANCTKNNLKTMKKDKSKDLEKRKIDSSIENDIQKTEIENKIPVKVLSMINPSTIYIILESQEKELNTLSMNLIKQYKDTQPPDVTWEKGDECVAFDPKSEKWYRGLIEAADSEKCRVFLKDIAKTENIEIRNLRETNEQFLSVKVGSIRCSLHGIVPAVDNKWPRLSCEYLHEIISGCEKFSVEKEDLFTVEKEDLQDNISIRLWALFINPGSALEPTYEEWKLVSEMIVDRGLAIRDPNRKPDQGSFDEPTNSVLKNNEKTPLYEPTKMLDENVEENTSMETDVDSLILPLQSVEPNKTSLLPITEMPILNLTMTTWKPPILPIKDFIGLPTFVDNDFNIYLINVETSIDILEDVNKRLTERFENLPQQPEDMFWYEGQPCIAQYYLDSKYYRGIVIKNIIDTNSVEVMFVDYGNTEVCPISSLRKSTLMVEIPKQAIKCRIVGVKPIGGTWKEDTMKLIHQTIVENECFIKVLGTNQEGDTVYIILNIPNACDLANLLVTMKLAEYDNYPPIVEIFSPPDVNSDVVDDDPDILIDDQRIIVDNEIDMIENDEYFHL